MVFELSNTRTAESKYVTVLPKTVVTYIISGVTFSYLKCLVPLDMK